LLAPGFGFAPVFDFGFGGCLQLRNQL